MERSRRGGLERAAAGAGADVPPPGTSASGLDGGQAVLGSIHLGSKDGKIGHLEESQTRAGPPAGSPSEELRRIRAA